MTERLRGRRWMAMRKRIITAHPICQICNAAVAEVVDHIVPLAKGGTNDDDNLQSACKPCNVSKGVKASYQARIIGADGWPILVQTNAR